MQRKNKERGKEDLFTQHLVKKQPKDVKSCQKSNWPLTINGSKKTPVRIKCALAPDHLRLEADVRKGGFFHSSCWRQHHEPNGLFSLTLVAILKILKGWESFWRLGETDAFSPSCAASFHHRQVQAPKPVGLQPSVKVEHPALGSALPFHHSFAGTLRQTPRTAHSTPSSALLQPFAGNKRFSSSCSRQKAECGQAVTAEAGRPSCMKDAERAKKRRDEQAGWHNRWGDRHEPDPGQAGQWKTNAINSTASS